MSIRGSDPGPFFKFINGQPLTKAKFTQMVQDALQAMGLPHNQFAGHSFRIGAATAAAQAGVEDSVFCTMGRWNSSAFLLYIRTCTPYKISSVYKKAGYLIYDDSCKNNCYLSTTVVFKLHVI